VQAFNNLLHAAIKANRLSDALTIYNDMQVLKIQPDLYTFNTLIHGYANADKVLEAYGTLYSIFY
jgi:pentatricopeptide repeat protein